MELPAANVSTPAISPQTSKNTLSAFYHLLEREHDREFWLRTQGTGMTLRAGRGRWFELACIIASRESLLSALTLPASTLVDEMGVGQSIAGVGLMGASA
jgi:hypothetical protein